MRPLYDYIAGQLAQIIRKRQVVVWYDQPRAFASFIAALRGSPNEPGRPAAVSVEGITTQLIEYAGSMFEVREAAEPFVKGDTAEPVLIYLPGCEQVEITSVLMELELAGQVYNPSLRRVATQVLRRRFTDVAAAELLDRKGITYDDIAHTLADLSNSELPSVLKALFQEAGGDEGLLAAWLMSESRDDEIAAKESTGELIKLIYSQLGLEVPEDTALPKLRAVTLRYVLVSEFRGDLKWTAPACLDSVPGPKTSGNETAVRKLASRLRASFADAYVAAATRIQDELGLRDVKLPGSALEGIETFRFEEGLVLKHCEELVAGGMFGEAIAIIGARERSFWLDHDLRRRAQWELCSRMAELGGVATAALAAAKRFTGNADAWVAAYTSEKDGWYLVDRAHRRLETWVTTALDEEPDERAIGIVRRAYEDVCSAMAEGFTEAFVKAGWTARESLHQTRVFSDVVSSRPKPVAYFLVDAMRFEMGVELRDRLPETSEISLRHAVASLPSITPIGMAALQPGAATSFNVVESDGKLGAQIEDTFLSDVASRKRFAAVRVQNLVDMTLDDVLGLRPSKLAKQVSGAQVVVVRSQEIDQAGETHSTFPARRIMDTVIDNLARAVRKLANAGIEHIVMSADHGHLFASDREESMRIEAPGGETVDLHRRCWVGRGGNTPAGCRRVSAATLGYASDLEFVFPSGCGVFKSGGDLAFHHGGPACKNLLSQCSRSVRKYVNPSAPRPDP